MCITNENFGLELDNLKGGTSIGFLWHCIIRIFIALWRNSMAESKRRRFKSEKVHPCKLRSFYRIGYVRN